MNRVLSPFVCLALAVSLTLPLPALAIDCTASLAQIDTPSTQVDGMSISKVGNHWKQEFIQAHKDHRPEGEIYALLKLALESKNSLKLSGAEVSAAKKMLLDLELRSLDQEFGKNNWSATFVVRLLNFLGLSHLAQKNVFGVAPSSSMGFKFKSLKTVGTDSLFFIGPLFLSLAKLGALTGKTSTDLTSAVLNTAEKYSLIDELAKADARPLSGIRAKLREEIQTVQNAQSKDAPRKSWYLGRALLPWIAALSIFATEGSLPRQYATYEFENHALPYGYQTYSGKEYLSDVTRQVGDLNRGKLLIAYSDNLFPKIDFKENAPMAVPEFRQYQAGHLDTFKISTIKDLKHLDLGSYDNIIILSHGLPDELQVGLSGYGFPKMKEGANIIYFSCLVGQKGGNTPDDENWIRFSKSILNGGKAIASTQVLWTNIVAKNAGRTLDPNQEIKRRASEYATEIGFEGTGFMQIIEGLFNGIWAVNNHYYFSPKGIRVYDSQSDKVTYIPSVDQK